ncbi:hypothetical protein NXF25_004392 [Crotalus adamanteus]|uniref:Uncharacterized protein n=1 Tax=Crotalus adamanteus TaxID=8729 RepID=A0AAW1BTV5_CROAD
MTKDSPASHLSRDSRKSAQGSQCQKGWSLGNSRIPCETQAALRKTTREPMNAQSVGNPLLAGPSF